MDAPGRHLTVATRLMGIPFGDPARDPFRPTLLVNPGLEQVRLVRMDSGRYRAATVEDYRPLGLFPPAPLPPTLDSRRDTSGLVASWLADDRLIVRCGEMFWTHEAAPDVTGHTAAVESGLAWADERNDADWLPVAPFEGPTYDPVTGLFRVGMGMDGPVHWRLTDRGIGATNALVAGPGGSGKSNTLRLALVEAMYSGVFDIAVADPLDPQRPARRSGQLRGAFGGHPSRHDEAAGLDGRAGPDTTYPG